MDFLYKAKESKAKFKKWNQKFFCTTKKITDLCHPSKTQSTEWEKIFAIDMSDKADIPISQVTDGYPSPRPVRNWVTQ